MIGQREGNRGWAKKPRKGERRSSSDIGKGERIVSPRELKAPRIQRSGVDTKRKGRAEREGIMWPVFIQ